MSGFKYRADIDGLRALAVILVLLFHAGLGFPGGFVGVDIFFVISGFLITGILMKENDGGNLSTFWARRIRRILPASLVVVATTLVSGYLIMLPSDFESLARSAIAQQAMMSNVFFWKNTGYFAGDSELQPLLHTWSLSVEEQFYLVYPFLMIFLRKFSRLFVITTLIAALLLSFALSEWTVETRTIATFFLLPTRAWEMLLGGVLFFMPIPTNSSKTMANITSVLGVAAILFPACLYDSSTRFPALAAVPPCLGAATLIYANSVCSTGIGRLLSSQPMVWVGLISYSLYLWHWPLLAFLKYLNCGAAANLPSRITALAASFPLAALSVYYIENPFRSRKVLPNTKHLVIALAGTVVAITGYSFLIISNHGLPGRFSSRALNFAAAQKSQKFVHTVTTNDVLENNIPTFGDKQGQLKCLVWGDSHAMALIPGIDASCKDHGIQGFQATNSSTAPLLDFYIKSRYGLNEKAPAFNLAVFDMVSSQGFQGIIMAGVWSNYAGDAQFERCLHATVDKLIQSGVKVAIVRDVAKHDADIPLLLSMSDRLGWDLNRVGVSQEEYLLLNGKCNQILSSLEGKGVMILDPQPYLTDGSGIWRGQINSVSMYRDNGHLSVEGGLLLKPMFLPFIDSLQPK